MTLVEAILPAIEGSTIAALLRNGRWSYAAVNAVHIFGIALLIGAILPLDLRFLGLWRQAPVSELGRVLVPTAATGLAIAVAAGLLLFSVRAQEYAGNPFLLAKLLLVATGASAALALHASHGWLLRDASDRRLAWHGALSIACWTAALACGRFIAFVD